MAKSCYTLDVDINIERGIERFKEVAEFGRLGRKQQRILAVFCQNPELNNKDIALKAGCSYQLVGKFFRTEQFHRLVVLSGKQEIYESVPIAIRAIKQCLRSPDNKIKLMAAVKVLEQSGVFQTGEVHTLKQDNKIMVVWDKQKPAVPGSQVEPLEVAIAGDKA